ncbi:MAG TPA: TrmH family RNA methyltransferase [Jatrophihabitans sp.]|nr:TrmH family RNA methyltransferase [Jatrophihabitans sp.]
MHSLNPTEIKRLNRTWRRRTEGRLTLVLASLANPYNVGSIFRSAATLGVDCIHLVGGTPGPEHRGVHKTSLGTEHSVPWQRDEQLATALAGNRAEGLQIVGIELSDTAQPLHEFALATDVCLVMGSEASGLTSQALAACDGIAYIPQPGKVASLNVAMAASIALYEVRRRHWQPPD